jgi:hypothetical protein
MCWSSAAVVVEATTLEAVEVLVAFLAVARQMFF